MYFAKSGLMTIAPEACLQRLEHRHRALQAADTSDVTGGRNHPSCTTADDRRTRLALRPIAFLNAGIKRITVDMSNG